MVSEMSCMAEAAVFISFLSKGICYHSRTYEDLCSETLCGRARVKALRG